MTKASFPAALHPECERLSCLVDGELSPDEAQRVLQLLCADAELRSQWVAFHVVGDALRSNEVAAEHSTSFCGRVSAMVAREPAILAPRSGARAPAVRRYLAPGLAVAASFAVIGFVAVPLMRTPEPRPAAIQQAAVQPAPVAAAAEEGTRRAAATVANVRAMQAYLAAHRELTTGVALPRATPYLRAPTEQAEGR